MTDKEKAIYDYLKKSHNRILKQYNIKHSDIKKLLKDVDFSKLDLSGLKQGEIIKLIEHKLLNNQLEAVRKNFQEKFNNVIVASMMQEWLSAHRLNDELFKTAYPNLDKDEYAHLYRRNVALWSNLKNRQLFEGRTLSGRVWELSHQFKRDIVDTIQIGIENGDSAREMAIRLERYTLDAREKLIDIDKLTNREIHSEMIRKINRNKKKGSLGSTFKDAKRLAGNETNISYREAEQDRWRGMIEVLGYEIELSNAHPCEDICDELKGIYPKWFRWNGWHPLCLCYQIPILMDEKDVIENAKRRLRGEAPLQKGLIKDIPEKLKQWIDRNREKAKGWSSEPYFIKDNKHLFKDYHFNTYTDVEKKFTRARSTNKAMERAIETLSKLYPDIPNTELAAIHHYTKDGGNYRQLNKQMEKGTLTPFNEAAKILINKGLDKLPDYEGTVYRGMLIKKKVFNNIFGDIGSTVAQDRFISSSIDDKIADKFAEYRNPYKTEYQVYMDIISKSGKDVSKISEFNGIFTKENQREILFKNNTSFDIVKKELVQDGRVVLIKLVER